MRYEIRAQFTKIVKIRVLAKLVLSESSCKKNMEIQSPKTLISYERPLAENRHYET